MQRDRPALEAPPLHTLHLIARLPRRHCVTSLRSARWLAGSLKLAARCPVSGCCRSCYIWPNSLKGVQKLRKFMLGGSIYPEIFSASGRKSLRQMKKSLGVVKMLWIFFFTLLNGGVQISCTTLGQKFNVFVHHAHEW